MQKSKMNFKLKSKKKGGFTLIEVIAVIAIICILVVALLPKFNGYIIQAKKVAVVDQCRKVVMAVESYNMKAETPVDKNTTTVSAIKTNPKIMEYIKNGTSDNTGDGTEKTASEDNLNKLNDNMTVEDCKEVVEGKKEFTINSSGVYTAQAS